VTEGILPGGDGGDILIGMDIITLGDFVITNLNGKTKVSFRIPSKSATCYVQEHNAAMNAPPRTRGAPQERKKRPGKQHGKHKR